MGAKRMFRRKPRTRPPRVARGNRRVTLDRHAQAESDAAGERRRRAPPPRRSRGLWRRAGKLAVRLTVAGGLTWAGLAAVEHGYDYATTSPRFEARALVFEPTPHVDDDHLRRLIGLRPGTNILALELDGLAGAVAEDPWVARASVVRELPDTLIVEVEEHVPVAVLLAGDFYLVNAKGQPFKRMDRGERGRLPVVTGIDRSMLFQRPHEARERIERGLAVLEHYQSDRRPRLSEVHVGQGREVILYTADRGTQLRFGRGEADAALVRYDALRAALGPRSEDLAVVHLDSTMRDDEPGRVVASFFDRAAAGIDPDAPDIPATSSESPSAPQAEPRRPDWRKDGPRIPRYD